jgi:hypothetical protein
MEENEFYERVRRFLILRSINLDQDPFILTDGDNSVLVKGEFAGYSLRELKELVARKEGKKIEYRD